MNHPIGNIDTVVDASDLRGDDQYVMPGLMLTPGQIGHHHLNTPDARKESGSVMANAHDAIILQTLKRRDQSGVGKTRPEFYRKGLCEPIQK